MAGYDSFDERMLPTAGGDLYAQIGGPEEGGGSLPLVLLHGFPQNNLMWTRVAGSLSRTRRIVALDLPGYGGSFLTDSPASASKREMAIRVCEAMAALGHDRFDVAGHDRGGRVAYRMALDSPQRVGRLAVLDILPTTEYWRRMNHRFAMAIYHWPFLAQPYPLPETLIGGAPEYYVRHTLASWTAAKSLSAFEDDAIESYCAQARDPARLKAMCDDYRAGESIDPQHDEDDREAGRRISCPTLVLWGGAGIAAGAATPLETWQGWCEDVRGAAIDAGHFIPEENPEATIEALDRFFN